MRYFILLLCISSICFANAQQKLTYTGSLEGGLLMGSKPLSSFVFTTQGVAYKQYDVGIGVGFDSYPFHSVPLFMDVKRRFGKKATQPFIQAAAGINFTSISDKTKEWFYQYGDGSFSNGLLVKGGGGLLLRAQKKLNITLSAGYSYKTASYVYKPIVIVPGLWQTAPVKDSYRFNRWYIGAGIRW